VLQPSVFQLENLAALNYDGIFCAI
jgi:hypothetical protein